MALSDRDIIIVPSRGTAVEPLITLRGADAASNGTITLRVVNSGTSAALSFEGNAGQLFSVSDYPSSTVFSVNDISGIPNIEVLDTGLVKLSEFNGNVQVGGASNSENATSTSTGELRVIGGMSVWKDLFVSGTITAGQFSGTVNTTNQVAITDDSSSGTTQYLTFVSGTSGNQTVRIDSSLQYIPSTNRLGIGVAPSYSLQVAAQSSPFQTVAKFGSDGSDILITHANAIISHNASYNGGWTRTGSGYAGQIDFQGGKFDFSTSPTTAAGGSSITDWTSRFTILNNGNVGIANSSPEIKLDVRGSDTLIQAREDGTSSAWRGRILSRNSSSDKAAFLGNYASSPGVFAHNYALSAWATLYVNTTNGSSDGGNVIIAGSGNAGIGTASPSAPLHVYRGSDPYLKIQTGGGSYSYIQLDDGSSNGYLIKNVSSGTGNNALPGALYTYTDNNKAFQHIHSGTPLFTILSSGNVGLGTTGPSTKLHIFNSTPSGVTSVPTGTDLLIDSNVSSYLTFRQTADSGIYGGIQWVDNNVGAYLVFRNYTGSGTSVGSDSLIYGTYQDHIFQAGTSGTVNGKPEVVRFRQRGDANFGSHITQGTLVSRPNATWGASGTSTGAVIIKFPGGSGNYGMIHAVIDIYTYDGENASTIIVGGHNWNSAWYNYGATRVGTFSKGVRVGFKDGQYCIVLGTNSSSWSYGQIVVRKLQNGSYYSGIMDLGGSYTVTQDAAAESYTWISGNLISTGGSTGWNSGNDGSGSGLDADLLDGIDSTQFVRDDAASYGYIQLEGGTQNSPTDGTLYVTATNNNDWLLRLNARNSSKSEYGAYVDIPNSASYAWAVLTDGGSWNWRINGSGHSFSPIYYDVNDTGRYMNMDGNNTSQIGTLRLNGDWGGAAGNGALTIRGTYPSMVLRATNGSQPVWLLHNDAGSTLYWYNTQSGVDATDWSWKWNINSSGVMIATGDVRAPIFYDYNDTNYYLDPAADLSLRVYGEISNSNYQQGYMQPGALNIGRTDTNYGWDGSTWASDIRVGILANCSELWEFAIHDSGDSVMSLVRFNGGNQLLMGRSIGWGTCYVEAAQDFRAPIFYDSNDTGYYVDPNGTTRLNTLITNSAVTSSSSMQAPIYYDSNDNNYWGDFNSISKMYSVQAENLGGAVLNRVTSNIGVNTGYREAITFIDGTEVQAHVSTKDGSGGCYQWYTTEWIWIDPEKDYEFSFWVRSDGTANIYFGWHELNSAGNYISSNPYFSGGGINTNGTWVKRTALLRNWRTTSGQANSEGTDRYASTTSRSSTPDVTDGVMHSTTRRIHLRFGTCYGGATTGQKTYFHLASIREVTGHDRQKQVLTLPYYNGSNYSGSMNFRTMTSWDNLSGIDLIGGSGEFRMSSDSGQLNLRVDGWMYAYDSSYFPFIYDQQDTGYYIDPNSTTRLNNLYVVGGVAGISDSSSYTEAALEIRERGFGGAQDDTWNTAPRIGFHWGGRVASQIAMASNGRIHIRNNPGTGSEAFEAGTIYSQIYYDSNNTGYYVDPASTSVLNALNLAGTTTIYCRVQANSPSSGYTFSSGGQPALWLESPYGDYGGICMDADGTTIYGAGDSGWVFRVIDEDSYQGVANSAANAALYTCFQVNQSLGGGAYVRGAFVATGEITAYGSVSDINKKENIVKIDNALEKISQLNGYTFNFKGDPTPMIGVIAQEVEKVFPQLVYTTEAGPEEEPVIAVRYQNITAVLIEAVKEQQSTIDKLTKELQELKELVKQSLGK